MWYTTLNIGTAVIFAAALLLPVLLQYIIESFRNVYNTINISIYGLYLIVYLLMQMTFSVVNNWRVPKKANELKNDLGQPYPNTDILVVGYRENETYYKLCLTSIKECYRKSNLVNKVIVVIDGNDDEDMYMVDIFFDVFGFTESLHIGLDTYDNLQYHIDDIKQKQFVCVTQPHDSKRRAMYTGFQINLAEKATPTILCTDSDTKLEVSAVESMIPLFADTKVGAVAGNLSIYTKYDSVVSFLSTLRYWYAFNLERAYQSFNNYVLCVSGPIGMYRMSIVESVMKEWLEQTFLGKKCTYGDDRHLTNRILSQGYKVLFTPAANASTETPSDVTRFYKQQTRWSKSAYREFLWSIKQVLKQNVFMTFDLIYLLIFPYIVMGYLLYILWGGNLYQLQTYTVIIAISGAVKTLFGVVFGKSFEKVFYVLYIIPYVSIVFPSKIWALLTITDTNWGTQHRNIKNSLLQSVSVDKVFLYVWNLQLVCALAFHLYQNVSKVSLIDMIPMITVSSIFGSVIVFILGYVMFNRKQKLQ